MALLSASFLQYRVSSSSSGCLQPIAALLEVVVVLVVVVVRCVLPGPLYYPSATLPTIAILVGPIWLEAMGGFAYCQ